MYNKYTILSFHLQADFEKNNKRKRDFYEIHTLLL